MIQTDGPSVEEFVPEPMPDISQSEKLIMEKEVTGMYLSGHPMSEYLPVYDKIGARKIGDILEDIREQTGMYHDGDTVTLLGVFTSVKTKITKITVPWHSLCWRTFMVLWNCYCFQRCWHNIHI